MTDPNDHRITIDCDAGKMDIDVFWNDGAVQGHAVTEQFRDMFKYRYDLKVDKVWCFESGDYTVIGRSMNVEPFESNAAALMETVFNEMTDIYLVMFVGGTYALSIGFVGHLYVKVRRIEPPSITVGIEVLESALNLPFENGDLTEHQYTSAQRVLVMMRLEASDDGLKARLTALLRSLFVTACHERETSHEKSWDGGARATLRAIADTFDITLT